MLRRRGVYFCCLVIVLLCGIFLRLPASLFSGPAAPLAKLAAAHPNPAFMNIGFDEWLYRSYVNALIPQGLGDYPSIVDGYIEVQKTLTGSILPPVRFLYIFAGYLWNRTFGTEPLTALRDVASLFSILTLVLATTIAWRLKGAAAALGVGALMSFAPTQLHMSQHALVDGFFTFWALFCFWALWENLRAPRNWLWLSLYALGLTLIVITKENSAFVFFALLILVIANRWFRWGVVTRELLAAMVIGPLLGVVILVFLVGGLETLVTTYQLSVSKNFHLPAAIMTGDGPWYRYIVDLFLVSPIILLLATGSVFRLDRTQKPELFAVLFIAASYLPMCNLKYGMNLRYANMWDMPLRLLAFRQIVSLADFAKRWRELVTGIAILLICVIEFHQYLVLCVHYPLYEPVPEELFRALKIIKTP